MLQKHTLTDDKKTWNGRLLELAARWPGAKTGLRFQNLCVKSYSQDFMRDLEEMTKRKVARFIHYLLRLDKPQTFLMWSKIMCSKSVEYYFFKDITTYTTQET